VNNHLHGASRSTIHIIPRDDFSDANRHKGRRTSNTTVKPYVFGT